MTMNFPLGRIAIQPQIKRLVQALFSLGNISPKKSIDTILIPIPVTL
jgi:hypothetical protein